MNTQTQHAIRLTLRNIEGALVRALGLTERRGFKVLGVSFSDLTASRKALELMVESERDVGVLKRQLEKLHDVFDVRIVNVVESVESLPAAAGC